MQNENIKPRFKASYAFASHGTRHISQMSGWQKNLAC